MMGVAGVWKSSLLFSRTSCQTERGEKCVVGVDSTVLCGQDSECNCVRELEEQVWSSVASSPFQLHSFLLSVVALAM